MSYSHYSNLGVVSTVVILSINIQVTCVVMIFLRTKGVRGQWYSLCLFDFSLLLSQHWLRVWLKDEHSEYLSICNSMRNLEDSSIQLTWMSLGMTSVPFLLLCATEALLTYFFSRKKVTSQLMKATRGARYWSLVQKVLSLFLVTGTYRGFGLWWGRSSWGRDDGKERNKTRKKEKNKREKTKVIICQLQMSGCENAYGLFLAEISSSNYKNLGNWSSVQSILLISYSVYSSFSPTADVLS